MKKDTALFNSVLESVKLCLNPFADNPDNLVNLCTGKAASPTTKNFLLSIREKWDSLRNDFIQRCVDDPAAFLKPLQRQKLLTFSSEGVKQKKKGPDDKTTQARMERDLFGRILSFPWRKR